jgi:hypothetical protein
MPQYQFAKQKKKDKIVKKKNKMFYEKQMPRTRKIPEVAIIVKTQGQDFKIFGSNIKVL